MHCRAAVALVNTDTSVVCTYGIRPQASQHRLVKNQVQLATRSAELWQFIARMPAARFLVDELAEAVEKYALVVLDADGFQLRQDTQLGKFAHSVR